MPQTKLVTYSFNELMLIQEYSWKRNATAAKSNLNIIIKHLAHT